MATVARRDLAYWTLLGITVVQAVAAIGGGIGLMVTNGLGMPAAFLQEAPFHSFLWPGLILTFVVGGTQVLAAITLLKRTESAYFWAVVAALGMLIWIFVETLVIPQNSWLQPVFFATGIAQLALVLVLAGITRYVPGLGANHRRSTWKARR